MTNAADRVDGGSKWLASIRYKRMFDYLSEALFLVERLMLPAEASRCISHCSISL